MRLGDGVKEKGKGSRMIDGWLVLKDEKVLIQKADDEAHLDDIPQVWDVGMWFN